MGAYKYFNTVDKIFFILMIISYTHKTTYPSRVRGNIDKYFNALQLFRKVVVV